VREEGEWTRGIEREREGAREKERTRARQSNSQVAPSQSTKQNMDAVEINTSGPPQSEDAIASAVKICRVCLLDNPMMRDLFLESEVASLSMKAMSFTNVKVRHIAWRLDTDANLAIARYYIIVSFYFFLRSPIDS